MNIYIDKDNKVLGQSAGNLAGDLIVESIQSKGTANILVATGASQFETLNQLINRKDIEWSKVVLFHLDEYINLSAIHPASFRKYITERLLQNIPPVKQAYLINGENDPEEECKRLAALISDHPIDVALIGIGENCHLAFNDPPADFDTTDPYIITLLDNACKMQQVNEGWFEGPSDVPPTAISISVKQLLRAAHIICSVPDLRKAQAVKDTLERPMSNVYPASILRSHVNCHLFLDKASASWLTYPASYYEKQTAEEKIA
ncbi:MAG: glucosamine-6-phosphate deaminase [Agriterribacter sp.]